MRLMSLTLNNFKGIKFFALEPQGKDTNIYGDNATGKTTLFDAFTWLLFGKDSQNRADFEIKTLGPDGEPEHGLEHAVEATLQLSNGKRLTLKKVFAEKWTKKRGSAVAEFTGHTTDHYIDGVPLKKKEYDEQIAEIADEQIFRLLTDPTYFNQQLHWQERRKILLEVCGDISDEEVIAADKALAKLPEILQGRRLEDHRRIIAARKAEINKELEKIPVRISEVQIGLPDITGIIPEKLPGDIAKLRQNLQEKQQELAKIESGGEIAEKTRQLREIEAEILKLETEFRKEIEAQVSIKQKAIESLQEKAFELQQKTRVPSIDTTALEKEIEQLRQKWYEINAQEFAEPDICPTCGQPLPAEKIEEVRANFNRAKAEKLEQISAEGKKKVALLESEKAAYQEQLKQAEKAKEELRKVQDEIEALKNEIYNLRTSTCSDNPQYAALIHKKQDLEKAIMSLKSGNLETFNAIRQEIETLNNDLESLERAKAKVEQYNAGLKRIEELKAQERHLAAEYERLEQELYLTEQFIRTKVKLLEEKINSRFKLARFKLFDVQVNGAVVECCETLYQGVPYNGGLNNAAKINVGLDIINTLSEHYGFHAPIFIDNREAVTKLIETKSQVISLIVSEPDKKLRVEVV